MSKLRSCGICCGVLSLWAIVQLSIMGVCFYYEAFTFLEEAMEYAHIEHVTDIDAFVESTKESYRKIAVNCWFAAAMYAGTLFLSCICIAVAKTRSKSMFSSRDEDIFCSTEAEKFTNIDKLPDEKTKKWRKRAYLKEFKEKEAKEKKMKLLQEKKQKQEIKEREKQEREQLQRQMSLQKEETAKKKMFLGQMYRNVHEENNVGSKVNIERAEISI